MLAYCREIVASEGTRLALNLGAVHLIFHPNAVSEPTSIDSGLQMEIQCLLPPPPTTGTRGHCQQCY